MDIALLLLTVGVLAQQPAGLQPELAVLKAGLGSCSADFTVTDANGSAAYPAIIHVRVRYGFMGVKRMDLEVGTNNDGKARIEGLPAKAKSLVYDITQDDRKGSAEQDLSKDCHANLAVSLRP
jgi:hypothetical protein